MHRAQLDGAGGPGEGGAVGGHEEHLAPVDARDPVRPEAVETPARIRRRLGLIGAQDGQLQIREQRGVGTGQVDDDAVLPLLVHLPDGLDDPRVP